MFYLKLFCIPVIMVIIAILNNTDIQANHVLVGVFNTVSLILLAIQAYICYNHVRKNK